jgi:hypothetical protein
MIPGITGNGFFGSAAPDPNLSYTVLLLGFDGVDGATAFNDESPAAHGALGFSGNAQLDTAQAKFGSASLLLDGSGDRVSYAEHDDFKLPTGPCSVELWVRPSSVTGTRWFIGHAEGLDAGDRISSQWVLWAFAGVPRLSFNDGSAWIDVVGSSTLSTSAWTHVAFERDNADKLRLYVGGVMEGSRLSGAGTTFDNAFTGIGLYIGEPGDFGTGDYAGHMDEIRILKGIAPWASDGGFTPPSSAYARS